MPALTERLILEYQQLFNSCVIREERFAELDQAIKLILGGRQHYEAVQAKTNVPWYFTGIIHCLEGSINFNTHLHNGDSLNAKTKNVPKDRPKVGKPPFVWEDSAIDALQLKSLDVWTDWSISGILFQFERYNGFGYRPRSIRSPYLWSFSTHYVRGKFVKDGIFSETAVSKQCGAAVLLRRMGERQIAVTGDLDSISQIKFAGSKVKFAPKRFSEDAQVLQRLLNSIGRPLRIDGFAGRMTSDAFFAVAGKFWQVMFNSLTLIKDAATYKKLFLKELQ